MAGARSIAPTSGGVDSAAPLRRRVSAGRRVEIRFAKMPYSAPAASGPAVTACPRRRSSQKIHE